MTARSGIVMFLFLVVSMGVCSEASPNATFARSHHIARQLALPELTRKGNNGRPASAFPLGMCEGDCDNDRDCDSGFTCFKRNDLTPVPGCAPGGRRGMDYCYDPSGGGGSRVAGPSGAGPSGGGESCAPGEGNCLIRKGNNGNPASAFPLGHCEADCDKDEDCQGNMVCFRRGRGDPGPPGCKGVPHKGDDYCINRSDLGKLGPPNPQPSVTTTRSVPTPQPTPWPTSNFAPPTRPPRGKNYYPANPVPNNPPKGYFNYDITDKRFGPDAWDHVDVSDHPFQEFGKNGFGVWKGHWSSRDPSVNRCGSSARRQSPKNLVQVAGGSEPGYCDAGHEIRSRCGSYPLSSDKYQRLILPHKLSLVMNRRPCLDPDKAACRQGDPPLADYPRYSSSISPYSDMLNFDIKPNGEHSIKGKFFDAEIQMLHTAFDNQRVSSIAIPVKASASGHNSEFQKVLNEFEWAYNRDAELCRRSRRNLRRAASNVTEWDSDWEYENSTETLAGADFARNLQKRNLFNPYGPKFMPGINFFRYDGSTTEPPCFPLTWWVMIDPMIISTDQLNQIRFLLFTHVDSKCRKTSVHNADQSTSRPIQPLGKDRGIQYCPKGSFQSDEQKGRGDGNKCP